MNWENPNPVSPAETTEATTEIVTEVMTEAMTEAIPKVSKAYNQ